MRSRPTRQQAVRCAAVSLAPRRRPPSGRRSQPSSRAGAPSLPAERRRASCASIAAFSLRRLGERRFTGLDQRARQPGANSARPRHVHAGQHRALEVGVLEIAAGHFRVLRGWRRRGWQSFGVRSRAEPRREQSVKSAAKAEAPSSREPLSVAPRRMALSITPGRVSCCTEVRPVLRLGSATWPSRKSASVRSAQVRLAPRRRSRAGRRGRSAPRRSALRRSDPNRLARSSRAWRILQPSNSEADRSASQRLRPLKSSNEKSTKRSEALSARTSARARERR